MRLAAILQAMSGKIRRLIALFLALALVVAGTAQVVQGSDMAVKMSAAPAVSDMPMPGSCGGCSGDDGMPKACFAVCASAMTAILPSTPLVPSITLVSPIVPLATVIAGHQGPPDPYPPRPISLG